MKKTTGKFAAWYGRFRTEVTDTHVYTYLK